jgi:hypothetical protein
LTGARVGAGEQGSLDTIVFLCLPGFVCFLRPLHAGIYEKETFEHTRPVIYRLCLIEKKVPFGVRHGIALPFFEAMRLIFWLVLIKWYS